MKLHMWKQPMSPRVFNLIKMTRFHKLVLVFTASIALCSSLKLASLRETYEKGVKAYSGERWSECIKQFEESLHLYKLYKSVTGNCRHKCNQQRHESEVTEDLGQLRTYEHFFNKKDCLVKCQNTEFTGLRLQSNLDESTLYSMQARKPYEYIHVCYFQMNALPKAASAAYTYLMLHPDDEIMKNNVQYYANQPEVELQDIVDLENNDYVSMYKVGVKAYSQQNWATTVANMNEALNDYLSSENTCRVECERLPGQESSPEFCITMSNNIAALLHCQQQCQDKLKLLEYNSGIEFIAEVLNYLQICYYKLKRYDEAAEAVESFLALLPNDADMLENKKIYTALAKSKSFTRRSEVEYYIKRDSYEKKLLKLFHQGNHHQDHNDDNSNTI